MSKCPFLLILPLILSCDMTEWINYGDIDCEGICRRKAECGDIRAEDESICTENCRKIKKYGYVQDKAGKNVNDCINSSCDNFRNCLNTISCKEPDFDVYVKSRCKKFDECGSIIPEVSCLLLGEESVKSEITNSFIRCSTDKLFEDISACIKQGACDYIESYVESCLEYYYILKSF